MNKADQIKRAIAFEERRIVELSTELVNTIYSKQKLEEELKVAEQELNPVLDVGVSPRPVSPPIRMPIIWPDSTYHPYVFPEEMKD